MSSHDTLMDWDIFDPIMLSHDTLMDVDILEAALFELPEFRVGPGLYRCTETDEHYRICGWPCGHHSHAKRSSWWMYDDLVAGADQKCPYCVRLRAFVDNDCHCTWEGKHPSPHEDHGCVAYLVDFRTETTDPDSELRTVRLHVSWACSQSSVAAVEMSALSTLGGDVARDMGLSPPRGTVREIPLSSDLFELCRGWIEECVSKHSECQSTLPQRYPGRLIEIHARENTLDIRLVDGATAEGAYVALSYCWGDRKPMMTTKSCLEAHEDGIIYDRLPACYRDAVLATIRLKMRYLWIDALCIVQDDDGDREREIACMDSTFRGALLVIVAAAAVDADSHFLVSRTSSVWKRHPVTEPPGNADILLTRRDMYHSHHASGSDDGTAISTRGWAYQERLLARSLLVFRQEEVIWECRHGRQCECSGTHPPDWRSPSPSLLPTISLLSSTDEGRAKLFDIWWKAVTSFSNRKLSYQADRLPAISGLAAMFSQYTKSVYLAGMWRQDLVKRLAWRPDRAAAAPYDTYIAPTWSWASYPSGILRRRWGTHEHTAEIMDAWCRPTTKSPFGTLMDGAIVLRAYHCTAHAWIPYDDRLQYTTPGGSHARLVLENGSILNAEVSAFDYAVRTMTMQVEPGKLSDTVQPVKLQDSGTRPAQLACAGSVHLLWLTDKRYLILAYCEFPSGSYKRIGQADGTSGLSGLYPELQRSEITII